MNLSFNSHFSLTAVEAELQADPRIQARALEVFGKREVMNSYLAPQPSPHFSNHRECLSQSFVLI